MIIILHEITL